MRESTFKCLSKFSKKDVNVKGYVRKRKGKTILVNPFKRKQELSDKQKIIRNAGIGIGATALLGTGILGTIGVLNRKALITAIRNNSNVSQAKKIKGFFKKETIEDFVNIIKKPQLKKEYLKNMQKVRNEAIELSKTIEVPKLDYKKNTATVVIGGFSGRGNNAIQESRGLSATVKLARRDKNIVGHISNDFNIDPVDDLAKNLKYAAKKVEEFKKANPKATKEEIRKYRLTLPSNPAKPANADELGGERVGKLIRDTFIKK